MAGLSRVLALTQLRALRQRGHHVQSKQRCAGAPRGGRHHGVGRPGLGARAGRGARAVCEEVRCCPPGEVRLLCEHAARTDPEAPRSVYLVNSVGFIVLLTLHNRHFPSCHLLTAGLAVKKVRLNNVNRGPGMTQHGQLPYPAGHVCLLPATLA